MFTGGVEVEEDDAYTVNDSLPADLPPHVRNMMAAMHHGQMHMQQQQQHQQQQQLAPQIMEAGRHHQHIQHSISDLWIYDARYVQQIGIRVRRFFPNRGRCDGTIIASLPADANGGIPLWRVRYDYGEDEIIDQRALVQYRQYFLGDVRDDPAAALQRGYNKEQQQHHLLHHPAPDDGKSDSDNDNDQVIEYTSHPDYNHLDDDAKLALLRKRYRDAGFVSGRSIECLTKDGALLHRFVNIRKIATKLKFPLHGIRACLMGMQHSSSGFLWRYYDEASVNLEERPISLKKILELKRKSLKGPSSTGRKCGRPSLNNRMTPEMTPVRTLDDDKMIMLEEGWTFDARMEKRIGMRVRRFFPQFGKSDGTIVAYLSPEANEGECLWHVLHDDGDREDVDIGEVDQYIQFMAEDVQVDPFQPAVAFHHQLEQHHQSMYQVESAVGGMQPPALPLIPYTPGTTPKKSSSHGAMTTPSAVDSSLGGSAPVTPASKPRRRAGRPRLSGAALAGEYNADESIAATLLPTPNIAGYDSSSVINSSRVFDFVENATALHNTAGAIFQYMAERETASFAISLRGLEQHVPALRGYVEGMQPTQFLAFSGVKLLVLDTGSVFPVDFSAILHEWCHQNNIQRDQMEESLSKVSEEMISMQLTTWHKAVIDVFLGFRARILGDAVHLHGPQEIVRSKTFKDIVHFFNVFLPLIVPTRSTKKANILRTSQFMRCFFAIRLGDDPECLTILPTLAVSVVRPVQIPTESTVVSEDSSSNRYLRCTFEVDLSDASDEDDVDVDVKPRRTSLSGTKSQHKPVEQLDLKTGKVLRRYASQGHAADKMKCTQGVISYCCRGERTHAYNFKWRFYRGSRDDFFEDDATTGYVPIKDLLIIRFQNAVGYTKSKEIKQNNATTWEAGSAEDNPDVKFYCSHIKPIEQVDLSTGRVLRRYLSGASAAKAMECGQAVISLCCRSPWPRCLAYNFYWRFYRGRPIDFDLEETMYSPIEDLLEVRKKPTDDAAYKRSALIIRPVFQVMYKTGEEVSTAQITDGSEAAVATRPCAGLGEDTDGTEETKLVKLEGEGEEANVKTNFLVVMKYPNIKTAGEAMNLTSRSIFLCCEGYEQKAGGFGWKYCPMPMKEGIFLHL
jgi:hypothetical protein